MNNERAVFNLLLGAHFNLKFYILINSLAKSISELHE